MKKILLPLFLIATSMGVTRLSAYCFYNKSKQKIYVTIFSKKPIAFFTPGREKSSKKVNPGRRTCWNWKEIAKKYGGNRTKLWYWVATSNRILGRGYFPIGGAVFFQGYKSGRAKFSITYDNKPWKYQGPPWNRPKRPWETFKR